jgi:hypothetical protein
MRDSEPLKSNSCASGLVRPCTGKNEKETYIMKNTLRTLLAFSTFALGAAVVPAFAGDSEPMRVTVPFAFMAGKTALPAGEYLVTEEDSGVITIKGDRGTAILLGIAGTEANPDKASISFERNEKGYFLKSVHGWGRISSSILPVTAGN